MDHLGRPEAVDDPDHVEPERVARRPVPRDPIPGGMSHFPLLPPVHGPEGTSIARRDPGLHLYEHNEPPSELDTLRDEIDVPVTAPKPAVENPPPPLRE